jgi:branched-chain amino acid transport system permease protein
MVFSGIHTILVIGLNLLMGYAGQISLGHAAFYGLGAYVYGVLAVKFGVHPWIGFLVAIVSTSLVALIIGYPSLKLKGHYLAIATLGFGIIFQIFFIQLDFLTGGPSGLTDVPNLAIGKFVFNNDFRNYYFVWIFATIILLLSLNIIDSRVGRAMRAINSSELAAETLGVNTSKYKIQIFVLSAAFASVAGTLYAHCLTFTAPETFGFMTSVLLLVMVVIGGIGNFWGSIIGAIGLTILPEYLRAYEELEVLLYGIILVVVMMFMPRGLAGLISTMIRRLSRSQLSS